jgi:hypothetical protein
MAKRKRSTFERINLDRMNRRQRRELGLRPEKSDPGLEMVHPHAAALTLEIRIARAVREPLDASEELSV